MKRFLAKRQNAILTLVLANLLAFVAWMCDNFPLSAAGIVIGGLTMFCWLPRCTDEGDPETVSYQTVDVIRTIAIIVSVILIAIQFIPR